MLDKILKIQKIVIMCFVILFLSQYTYDHSSSIYSEVKTNIISKLEEIENDVIKPAKKALNKWIFKI